MANWDAIYQHRGVVQDKPSKEVERLVPFFRERGIRRVLDHGCGTGRHLLYLASQGFEAHGLDDSAAAIERAKELTRSYNLCITKTGMDCIPYNTGYFGAGISSHVVQHALAAVREGAFQEFERVVRPKGLLLVRTISTQHSLFGRGRQLEPGTFVDIEGLPDGDVPHHYFTKFELEDLLPNFSILSIEHKQHPPSQEEIWKHGLAEWVVLAERK